MTSIDVIVPSYNYGRYLRTCVESVLRQDDVAVRVLIIDDCSSDCTPDVGIQLSRHDSRVEYRRHEHNRGHIATYNEGLACVTGTAALLLSADDALAPGALGRASSILNKHPEVGLVWGRQIVFDHVFPSLTLVNEWSYEVSSGGQLIGDICRTCANPVTTPTAVVRTSLLRDIGGYDAALPHTADMHYWLRCAARGAVASLGVCQGYKRLHGQNMQLAFVKPLIPDLEQRLAAVRRFVDADGVLVRDASELLDSARSAVAVEAFWAASKAFDAGREDVCADLLIFAQTLQPELVNGWPWLRLGCKRRLGVRLWKRVWPLVDRIRQEGTTLADRNRDRTSDYVR